MKLGQNYPYLVSRAAERIGGIQGKYKKWGPSIMDCVKRGLGARPQEILRFYMP